MQEPYTALIATHKRVSSLIADHFYRKKGYATQMLDLPEQNERLADSIQRLHQLLSNVEPKYLVIAVVEANYGTPGALVCARAMLDEIVAHYRPHYLVVESTTEMALQDAQKWMGEQVFDQDYAGPTLICFNTSHPELSSRARNRIPNISSMETIKDAQVVPGSRRTTLY